MPQVPEPVSKATLLAVLDDIRAHVEAGDSFEGYVEYAMPDFDDDPAEVDFRVKAGYRIGNLQGQGGFRMIGKVE